MTDQHRDATPGSQVATCQHPTCYLPLHPGRGDSCILHDPDPGKDAASFELALGEKIEREEGDDSIALIDLSGVVFPNETNFRGRIFTKAISFASARFTERINFWDTKFGGEVDFQDAEFAKGTYFWDTKFGGQAGFRNAEFSNEAHFGNAKFSGRADFQDTKYAEEASFYHAEFSEEAHFSNSEIHGDSNFSSAKFAKEAYFYNVKFGGEVSFAMAEFAGKSHFDDAEFSAAVLFLGAEFAGEVRFLSARFGKAVSFIRAKFGGVAQFADAEFGGESHFFEARFDGKAFFNNVKFAGEASFVGIKFNVEAFFFSSEFSGKVSFWGSEFAEEAHFYDTEFNEGASFRGATFNGSLDFHWASVRKSLTFQGEGFSPQGSEAMVKFTDLTLGNPQEVRFEGVNLSRASFLRTDVSHIRFVGCTWPLKHSPFLWPLPFFRSFQSRFLASERAVVYDEVALDERENKGENVGHDRRLVAELYRQLRLNLEATKQEAEAGAFYTGQMEMRRQDRSYHSLYRPLLTFYRIISMYGESYVRSLAWYVILAFIVALGYERLGSVPYSEGLFFALTAGVLLREVPTGIESWEKLLVYFNMLSVILLLGLTVVALRRHFSR